MPRKSKHRSRKTDKGQSFLYSIEDKKFGFSALKSIEKVLTKDLSTIRRKDLQLTKKAKRKLIKLKALPSENTRILQRIPSKSSVMRTYSFLSVISDEFESGHGQLMKLRSKDDIIEESESNIYQLEKLLDDREKSFEEEEEEVELGSDGESDDSYVEDKEATMERIRKTFKKANLKTEPVNIDFFETLGGIPSIENISLDLSGSDLDLAYGWKKPEVDQTGLDIGRFVDPLTGASLESSTITPVESVMILPELVPEASVIIDDQASEGGLMGVDFKDEVDEDLDVYSDKGEDDRDFSMGDIDDLGKWFGISSRHKGLSVDKFHSTKTDFFVRHMIPYVYDFMHQLINQVVETAHYAEPAMLLRQNFNKKKIMDDLEAKMRLLEDERQLNMVLNKKIVEYYRRKKDFRPLTEDPPENVMSLFESYNENMEKLSTFSSQEQDFTNITSIKMSDLNEILQQEEKLSRQSVDNLEKLIRKTIGRDRYENLNDVCLFKHKTFKLFAC